jgi:hypothetical protein
VRELESKQKRAEYAWSFAQSQQLVHYHQVTYIPADYEVRDDSCPPEPDRTIWIPLSRSEIIDFCGQQYNLLFDSDEAKRTFEDWVGQHSAKVDGDIRCLLVRTPAGLRCLGEDGRLVEPTGKFVPNTLTPMLNEDPAAKAEVFKVIVNWLGSDEDAESLLAHLATCLSPGWSAVKYVLLLGEGRNGKSLLLRMVEALFGDHNVSQVTRQAIATESPAVLDLNGKLVNIVYDGMAGVLKDSGQEKTLIAGEKIGVRRLWESTLTTVQTNALFLEGLNREPKTWDKSMALQRRMIRFRFGNTYPLNREFERHMLSEPMLGAFMALLIERYVLEDELAERLRPTTGALALQLESMFANNKALQFLQYLEEQPNESITSIFGLSLAELSVKFHLWRQDRMDYSVMSPSDVWAEFSPLIHRKRKSVRINGKPRKDWVITGLQSETADYIMTLKGDENDDETVDSLVDD